MTGLGHKILPPRPHEIVLWIATPQVRGSTRCKGPDRKEVDALVASFANN